MTLLQDYAVLGALIFFAFGVIGFLGVYFAVLRRSRDDGSVVQRPGEDRNKKLLMSIVVIDLVGFPIVGYFIGPLVLPGILG